MSGKRRVHPVGKLAIAIFVLCVSFPRPAQTRQITGNVLDEKGIPLPGATVRVQATEITSATGADGKFVLRNALSGDLVVTAWKDGFVIGGISVPDGKSEVTLRIHKTPAGDNADYKWVSPAPPALWQKISIVLWRGVYLLSGNEKVKSRFESNCSNCHGETTVAQWRKDAHSNYTGNKLLMSMYNGTGAGGKEGILPGYKLDFPNSAGNCAACHAPVRAVKDPFGTDLNMPAGPSENGITCDFCHKIKEVKLHAGGGYPGVLSIKFNRPPNNEQIFYGPFDDVSAGPDTYSRLHRKSLVCAPCHSGSFWGTPAYSEYDEWLKSPYPAKGIECQDCHMAPDGKTKYFVPPEKKGVMRDPKTIATHLNPGSRDKEFISQALTMELAATRRKGGVAVTVKITNEKAGHHVPTGVPMRNMILLVEAYSAEGKKLAPLQGPVVPEWGGGKNGNYAGLPGKGFARILEDIPGAEPAKFDVQHRVPAPHWRQTRIVYDNRIPAGAADESHYLFKARPTEKAGKCGKIRAVLIYRRSFRAWIEAKGLDIGDMEIGKSEIVFCN